MEWHLHEQENIAFELVWVGEPFEKEKVVEGEEKHDVLMGRKREKNDFDRGSSGGIGVCCISEHVTEESNNLRAVRRRRFAHVYTQWSGLHLPREDVIASWNWRNR